MSMNLPSRLQDARHFIQTLDLRQIEAAIADETRAQLVIIGPVNSGKSTLFNKLKGQKLSAVSAVPGTTRQLVAEQFGPFSLVDTPGMDEVAGSANAAMALQAVEEATVVILVLDAAAGVRQSDANLIDQVRAMGLPVVVALNKIDLVRRDLKQVLGDVELKLGMPVIPISAKNGQGIGDQLIPAIIESHPRMAVTVGRALPRYRKIAAARVMRESAAVAAFMGVEPIPLVGLPFLIAVQIRMLLRLAAIYGQPMGVARARELIGAIAGGLAIRYAAQELVKLIPGPGWLIAGGAAWTGTNALGGAAIAFFESSQKLSSGELRSIYKRLRWRLRQPKAELDDQHGQS
jgi:small GTP-binding protein